ncbi:MAG: hypothetical protein AAGA34_02495 [Pseudomonadota bacterium]
MLFSGQAKPTRCGKIETAWIADDLSDHASKVFATHTLFEREKRVFGSLGLNMDQPIAPFTGKPMEVGPTTLLDGSALLHP